jgi:hypothetical protein
MKLTLLVRTVIIMISATTTITIVLQQQHHQIAQAYPCVGGSTKEYCTGYHNGAILAYRDFNAGNDLTVGQHPCRGNSTDYCNGYIRGYNDEADFLG